MGKYIAYILVVFGIIFCLEFFGIVDIPYFSIPDFTGQKEQLIEKSRQIEQQLGD
jgi:hypothetical protein